MKSMLGLKRYLCVISYFKICYSFKGFIWFSLLFSSCYSIFLDFSYSSNLTCFICFDYMAIENEILVKWELRCNKCLCVYFLFHLSFFFLRVYVLAFVAFFLWVKTHYNEPKLAIESPHKSSNLVYLKCNETKPQIKTFQWY